MPETGILTDTRYRKLLTDLRRLIAEGKRRAEQTAGQEMDQCKNTPSRPPDFPRQLYLSVSLGLRFRAYVPPASPSRGRAAQPLPLAAMPCRRAAWPPEGAPVAHGWRAAEPRD